VKWKSFLPKLVAVLVSALLLTCAFPLPAVLSSLESPSGIWLALIPLIIVLRLSRPKQAFWWGWLCGFLFWLVSLAWLLQLRNTWGMLSMVVLGWIGLSAYCAIYVGLFGLLLASILPDKRRNANPEGSVEKQELPPVWRRLLPVAAAPIIWVGLEYLRGIVGTGFPWNALGVSQYANIASIQIASLGGVYAVSATIVLLNAALALTALRTAREVRYRLPRGRIHFELMLGLLVVALAWSFGVRRVKQAERSGAQLETLRVAAVQPNIAQPKKWSEDFCEECYRSLGSQSSLALTGGETELLIWPETALPDVLPVNSKALGFVRKFVAGGACVLVGSMNYQRNGNLIDYFNSSFIVDKNGRITGEYRKRHLVPFGEYIPFERQLSFVRRFAPLGFSCLSGGDQALLKIDTEKGLHPFGVLICFEDVFSQLARADVRAGAAFLANQTNDAWFDGSAAPRQHMANAVFRAVENRVPMVRCTNTGITCFIDRFGRIYAMLGRQQGGMGIRGFRVAELAFEGSQHSLTPYTKYGDRLFAIPCAILVLLGLAGLLWQRFRRKGSSH
jgi:apolipoprotein N-acyltransferase